MCERCVAGFVGADEAATCELKHAIAKAAARQEDALRKTLGQDEAEDLIDLAARGPITRATAGSLHQPTRASAGPRRAAPCVATMSATM
jgi:hypothetical protein